MSRTYHHPPVRKDGHTHPYSEKPLNNTMMRILPLTAALAVAAPGLEAQNQERMKANYAKMLEHEWYTGGGWTTDFDAAKRKAKETGKPIFAYFTRTYSP